jgi:hypothetical protein
MFTKIQTNVYRIYILANELDIIVSVPQERNVVLVRLDLIHLVNTSMSPQTVAVISTL